MAVRCKNLVAKKAVVSKIPDSVLLTTGIPILVPIFPRPLTDRGPMKLILFPGVTFEPLGIVSAVASLIAGSAKAASPNEPVGVAGREVFHG